MRFSLRFKPIHMPAIDGSLPTIDFYCRHTPRSGIALIMAIVILAALLMLGLPFLMSQSSSLGGARSFRAAEQVKRGAATGIQLGMTVGIASATDHFHIQPYVDGNSAPVTPHLPFTKLGEWVAIPSQIQNGIIPENYLPPWSVQADTSRTEIANLHLEHFLPRAFPLSTSGSVLDSRLLNGVRIEDESGKLDPNTMSTAAWDALIRVVLGEDADWDDDEVICSRVKKIVHSDGSVTYIQDLDLDHFGELARALAELPHSLPGRRITDLDQLLLADTEGTSPSDDGRGNGYTAASFTSLTGISTSDWKNGLNIKAVPSSNLPSAFGLRRPLTRSELNQLRPYLSIYNPPPGREGLIDFGTIVSYDVNSRTMLWDSPGWIDHLFGLGACMRRISAGAPQVITDGWFSLHNISNRPEPFLDYPGTSPTENDALALHAQAVINLNASTSHVFNVLNQITGPAKELSELWTISAGDSILGIPNNDPAQVALTGWHLTDPYRVKMRASGSTNDIPVSLPPVGIAGSGIFTITSDSAVTNHVGTQEASSHRRSVVQALPQEGLLERRWTTQAEMATLVAQHFSSNIDTWPHPINRLFTNLDTQIPAWPSTVTTDNPVFRPGILPSWATWKDIDNPPSFISTIVDWVMKLGAAQSVPIKEITDINTGVTTIDAPILATYTTGTNPTPLTSGNTKYTTAAIGTPNPFDQKDLRPDGLLLLKANAPDAHRRLAVTATEIFKNDSNANQRPNEMTGRHISLWVKPDANWIGSGNIIPIFEARVDPTSNMIIGRIKTINGDSAIDPSGNPTLPANHMDADGQNLLGLYYDPAHNVLALVIAPPTAPTLGSTGVNFNGIGPLIPWDDPMTTKDLDERCLGFGNADALPQALSNEYNINISTAGLLMPWRLAPIKPQTELNNLRNDTCNLLGPNRIVTLYSVTSSGGSYFTKDRWYHIQAIIGSSRPGGTAIILDDIAGRDVTRDPADVDYMKMNKFGDYATLPALPLASNITSSTTGTQKIKVVPLECNTKTIHAADVFPARGMLRIKDEYISYRSISAADEFEFCIGGQRQEVDKSTSVTSNIPYLKGRLVYPGDYCIDGAESPRRKSATYDNNQDPNHTSPLNEEFIDNKQLFRGGCYLADNFYSGDSTSGSQNVGLIWAALPKQTLSHNGIDHITDPGNGELTLQLGISDAKIPLQRGNLFGVAIQFPSKGIVSIDGKYFGYGGIDLSDTNYVYLTQIQKLDRYDGPDPQPTPSIGQKKWVFYPRVTSNSTSYQSINNPSASDLVSINYTKGPGNAVPANSKVRLISLRVKGANPAESIPTPSAGYNCGQITIARYSQDTHPIDDRLLKNMIQLMDPTTGRVEWIEYRCIAIAPDGEYYFVSSESGWDLGDTLTNGRRARMRTDFHARSSIGNYTSRLKPSAFFPVDTPVIPVQTDFGNSGRFIATGDVLTLMTSTPGKKSVQAVVRYAAAPGFETFSDITEFPSTSPDVRATNRYFAFAHHLPDDVETDFSKIKICSGTCWTSQTDLSPISSITNPVNPSITIAKNFETFLMPHLNAWADGVILGGSMDDDPANLPTKRAEMTIDAISGGPIPPICSTLTTSSTINGWAKLTGAALSSTDLLDVSTAKFPCFVLHTDDAGNPQDFGAPQSLMGLINIGGEVFAYQVDAIKSRLRIVGRGLLGSKSIPHQNVERFLFLPNGPVAMLDGSIPTTTNQNNANPQFILTVRENVDDAPYLDGTDGIEFNAPMALICNSDGSDAEIMMMYTGGKRQKPTPVIRSSNVPQGSTPDSTIQAHWNDFYHIPYFATAWTRGLYNTKLTSWTGAHNSSGSLRPIVIGYWPRYPSALPNDTSLLSPQDEASMLRSRVYSWVGFPHGFHDSWFKNTPNITDPLAILNFPTENLLFRIETRALSQGLDWTKSTPIKFDPTNNSILKLDSTSFNFNLFDSAQFNRPVSGMEMRVHWRYSSAFAATDPVAALQEIARNANTAPELGPVRLRCLAPCKVLATENER